MRKSIFLVIFILIFLSGCSGSNNDGQEQPVQGFHFYSTEEFKIEIPNEWEVISPDNFTSDIAPNTLIGFRNNIRGARFTSNAVVIKNAVSQENTSSLDYAKALYAKVKDSLNDFREVEVEQVKINIDNEQTDTLYTVSQGRDSTTSDIKQYYYISGVKNSNAYIAVGSMSIPEGESVAAIMQTMVRSFQIR